jgi:class 3 adenylate cyclase
MDLTSHTTTAGRKAGIRLLKAISTQSEGAISDEVTGRLYRLLEDPDKSVRVEALLALLAIGDDYAAQVLKDFVVAGDSQVVADVLAGISRPPSRETFAIVLDCIGLEKTSVQEELRKLLPDLSQGGFAEEIRQKLVEALTALPGGRAQSETAAPMPAAPPESTLDQGKVEFKFKREHTRRLTVFFVDIADSTEKSNQLDMSIWIKIIKAFEDVATSTIASNRGIIVKKMGDGMLAVFKHPLNAVKAALEVQKKIRDYSAVRVEEEKFQARVGLNTGSVIRRDKDIFGETVNVASRMQGVAQKGEVVLTQPTFDEIKDFVRCTPGGKVQVKGIKDPVMVYYAKEVTRDLNAVQDNLGTQGREKGSLRDPSLEKLKESMFVPNFQPPQGKNEHAELMTQLQAVFSYLSQAVEEMADDYRDEYDFKKYLQDRWNALLESL